MRLAALVTVLIISHLLSAPAPASAQQRQNPSPMVETARRHERFAEQSPAGKRLPLSLGTLLMPARRNALLIVHFHGPQWLAELSARRAFADAAVLSVQAGVSSDPYSQALAPPGRFEQLMEEAESAAGQKFPRVVLSSFSAGYGATREILRDPANHARIQAVVFADSMHADYTRLDTDLDAFLEFAGASVSGRKQMVVAHSEVFPGTYASTTEAADHILKRLRLKRAAVLRWGPIGMQQISELRAGGLTVLGYAGNSAPDHIDHLYALGELYRRVRVIAPGAGSQRKPPTKIQSGQMKR